MSPLVRICGFIAAGAVLLLIALSLVGGMLQRRGMTPQGSPAAVRTIKACALTLFGALAFAIVPLFVHLFVALQGRIGNSDVSMVATIARHELGVCIALWSVWGLGLLIAFPVMARDLLGWRPAAPRSQGTVVLNVGMSLDEVLARSTLSMRPPIRVSLTHSSTAIAEATFDWEIAGTGIRLPQCRYYAINTPPNDESTVSHVNIGISPRAVGPAELAAADASLRQRLIDDGWQAGRFVHTTERDLTLSGGKPTTGEGRYWARDGSLLILSSKRIDDAVAGEDPTIAGRFIQVVDLLSRGDPSYAKLVYGPISGAPP